MSKLIIQKRKIALLLLAVITLSVAACKVQLVSAYDDAIHTQIVTASKDIDTFYTQMLATTTQGSTARQYSNYAASYATIEVELRQLQTINNTRAKNTQQTGICKAALDQWIQYEDTHKTEGMLNDVEIKINRGIMLGQMQAMEVSERVKTLGESKTNTATTNP